MILVVKPQWKAAIDFKWIRDNKDAVALNIKNRNSNANLELVLELHEKMLAVQKVRFILFYQFLTFF
jgi:seryl-tRNA synthetase